MRRLYVGANVSPMTYDMSPATTLIKPALLSYQLKTLKNIPCCGSNERSRSISAPALTRKFQLMIERLTAFHRRRRY